MTPPIRPIRPIGPIPQWTPVHEAALRLRLAANALATEQAPEVARHHARLGLRALEARSHCLAVPPEELLAQLQSALVRRA